MFRYARRLLVLCTAWMAMTLAATAAQASRTAPDFKPAPAGGSGFVLAQKDDPLVCCATPNGFSPTGRSRCRSAGGREVAAIRCRRSNDPQVCCATPDGFFRMSARACRNARGRVAPPLRCHGSNSPQVCCATPNGFFTMSRRACSSARGHAAAAVRCAPQALVCCRFTAPDGRDGHRLMTSGACRAERGRMVHGRACHGGLRRVNPPGGG